MSQPGPIHILYNPKSTGNGYKNAKNLEARLKKLAVAAEIIETKHAGHAVELARKFANIHSRGMIISSSGDGGYHEVVNGVLSSKHPGVITGVLPSGNANDHYHFVHRGSSAQRISKGDSQVIDVLQVKTPSWMHYAHSYAGLGITPQIGRELTKNKLNKLVESWLVIKNLFRPPIVKIRVGSRSYRYKNLVFSNSGRMSKYLTLSTSAKIDDGFFEITRVKDDSLFSLFRHLFKATAGQIEDAPQAAEFRFIALHNMSIQLDGEVYLIASGEEVVVTCLPQALRCIV
jgi:diacylglycerol kinase (ATP)